MILHVQETIYRLVCFNSSVICFSYLPKYMKVNRLLLLFFSFYYGAVV
jgi:hypothetical protein